MRRLLIFFISLFIHSFLSAGIIEKTYFINTPTIESKNGFDVIRIDDMKLAGHIGCPALPYHAVSLMLPLGEEAVSINVEFNGLIKISGSYNLLPMQYDQMVNSTGKNDIIQNLEIYSQDQKYPNKTTGELYTHFLQGQPIALSTFTPFQYNPVTGELAYYSQVKISIQTGSTQKAIDASELLRSGTSFDHLKRSLAQNPEVYQITENRSSFNVNEYQLLIITDEEYENSFDDLAINYLKKGFKYNIKSTQEIEIEVEGIDLAEKIRNYIKDEYINNVVEHIILGGDIQYIPYRGLYCGVQAAIFYSDDNIPGDIYYSALDGNWNNDNDGLWGEIGEDDILPDVSVARMSFSNEIELQNMIHKSLMYQNNPVLGEFEDPLFVGEHLTWDPSTFGADYLELHIGIQNGNGYNTVGIPEYYNTHKLYELYYPWVKQDLIDQINNGRPTVYHVGHANETSMMKLHINDITNGNFYAANGVDHNYSIVYSQANEAGAFDHDDCIAEKMVSINNFAASFIGNSREGWMNEGTNEGPSQHLHREFTDATYGRNNTLIGLAHVESKLQVAPWVSAPGQFEDGAQRWVVYDCNILGDPLMSVWTREPFCITASYQQTIPIESNNMEIVIEGDGILTDLRCAALKDGELIGIGISDQYGNVNLEFFEPVNEIGEANFLVSGSNCFSTYFDFVIIPTDGPYVICTDVLAVALSGNEEVYNYGETVILSVEMTNVGEGDANNVNVVMTSENDDIIILDDEEYYDDFDSGDSFLLTNGFAFEISNSISDQSEIELYFNVYSTDGNWISSHTVIANAPKIIETGIVNIMDDEFGDGNGYLDPGELVTIQFGVSNEGHSISDELNCYLISDNEYVNVITEQFQNDALDVGEGVFCEFLVQVNENALFRDLVEFNFQCLSGAYILNTSFTQNIGMIAENFENADFNTFDWINNSVPPWEITNENVGGGLYSAVSGDITHNQSSTLKIVIEVISDDSVSFMRKVSSEQSYDYLYFYIDNQKVAEWSGEQSWGRVVYPLSVGEHILKWVYQKDDSESDGLDHAWVDNIIFPTIDNDISIDIMHDEYLDFELYPIPCDEIITIESKDLIENNLILQIYSSNGILIYESEYVNGFSEIELNISDWKAGVYIVKFISDKKILNKRIIKT